MTKDLPEIAVAPDTFEVSPSPVILVAQLSGALGLCLHDEDRAVGGLLHLRYHSGDGRPTDVTDNTLSSVLLVLDKFRRAVLGNNFRPGEVQARVIAQSAPPAMESEPTATIVDLVRADFVDSGIQCGSQVIHRTGGVRLCFEPYHGRVWVSGPDDRRGLAAQRHAAARRQG